MPKWRFFTTASFCLHVWVAVSVRALAELKGALQGTWLFPILVPCSSSWFDAGLAVFTSVKMAWDFQLGAEPWRRVSISRMCLQDIYTSACLLLVSFMHLFLVKWSSAHWWIYPWVYFQVWMIEGGSSVLNRPWVRVKNLFLLVVVYINQGDFYYIYILSFL